MEEILIGGRRFKGANGATAEHDAFTQAQIARANLGRLEMMPGEDHQSFALRIYRSAALNGDVFLLLGCLLFPAEVDPENWTPQTAEATATFLRKLTREEDKTIIRGQILSMIMVFMQSGLAYGVISPSSSIAIDQVGQSSIAGRESSGSGTVL